MYRNTIFGLGTLNRISELLPEDAEHGLVDIKALKAVYESAERGGAVELD